VLKVKKIDLAPEPSAETEEDAPRAAVVKPRRVRRADKAAETTLSAEQEADLMAELDAVQDTPADADAEPPIGLSPREQLDEAAEQPEHSVNRLVDEVNTIMEGPEHRRRRSAIAHLKAAVAATVAERRLPKGRSKEDVAEAEKQPYRQDLEKVVRPGKARAEGQKMPPLVLVSEQRIDAPKNNDMSRPSGISMGNLAIADDDEAEADAEIAAKTPEMAEDNESFEDFAARLGAKELPELLEAAAVYMLTVKEQPFFTRPKVMRTAAAVIGQDNFEREDGLRAFGTLLREGPFERIQRGQFTISKTSRYMK